MIQPMSLRPGQRVRFDDGEGVVAVVADGIATIGLTRNTPGCFFRFCFASDVPEMEVVS